MESLNASKTTLSYNPSPALSLNVNRSPKSIFGPSPILNAYTGYTKQISTTPSQISELKKASVDLLSKASNATTKKCDSNTTSTESQDDDFIHYAFKPLAPEPQPEPPVYCSQLGHFFDWEKVKSIMNASLQRPTN